jgi:O-antigen ligase
LTAGGARSSHNVFLTVLVEQGIPGAVLFLGFIYWTTKALRRLKAETATRTPTEEQKTRAVQAAAVGGALTIVLAAGMFADFSKCEVQIWMIALLAALLQPVGVGQAVLARSSPYSSASASSAR